MCLAGVFSIRVVRRRSDMARASVKATVIGFVAVSAYLLAMGTLFSEDALRMLLLIGLNGLLCLFLVPGLLSPLERVFGITTDIQLLEYSDLNNEILSRMAIEIPATNAHSQRLGQLAEAAADAIGANGLLAQVCAYYHDIGKLKRPEYFAENQTGVNIHDDLSPRLSARAIASHVLEGAEMAREMHLPKPIVDGILEHHGTSLISFFYQEALAQQKHGDVREEDFRYPGPKPQRRETAILMICDAAESGVRTIKNPNEERIREFVDKIVKARADDGQFDECDLTLKDLDTIKEIVTSRLVSFAHERIAYPDQKEEKDTRPPNVVALRGGQES
jgi:putative nucleotidyltransferase with HDIG domain